MKKLNLKLLSVLFVICGISLSQFSFAQMKPKDGSSMAISKYSYGETVDLLKGAIEEQNLMVIHQIDAQKMLRMAGKQVGGMSQIFYFHPMYMRKVMEANPEATIQIPLKFIVMEKPDQKVVIRYFKPSVVLNNYEGEAGIATDLDGLVAKIISGLTN